MKKCPSSLFILVVALAASVGLTFAQTDAVSFQTFNPQDVAIQLVSVERTGPDDITVTWQILNRSKTAQQFDKMNGVAAYQLVWDAEVIDLASRTRFKVASDPRTRTPVAAKHEPPRASQGVGLAAGRTLTTWAKFLVPANVTNVTVSLPGAAKPWENVAIGAPLPSSSSAGPSPPVAPSTIRSNMPLKDLGINSEAGERLDRMVGGNPVYGTVALSQAPPAGGLLVTLTSSNPDVVKVPSQITVNQGATSAETGPVYVSRFDVTIRAVRERTPITITARAGGQALQANVVVMSPGVTSANVSLYGGDLTGAVCDGVREATVHWTLNGPAPSGDTKIMVFVTPDHREKGVASGDREGTIKFLPNRCQFPNGCSFTGYVRLLIEGQESPPTRPINLFCRMP
jgi:hypothetical protein